MAVKELHPAIASMLKFFEYGHLPVGLQQVSKPCAELARRMAAELPPGPEVTVGLRKLLEAKDCFVRAQLNTTDEASGKYPAGLPMWGGPRGA